MIHLPDIADGTVRFLTSAPEAADVEQARRLATVGLDTFTGCPVRAVDVPAFRLWDQKQAIRNAGGAYATKEDTVRRLVHRGRWRFEDFLWDVILECGFDDDHL